MSRTVQEAHKSLPHSRQLTAIRAGWRWTSKGCSMHRHALKASNGAERTRAEGAAWIMEGFNLIKIRELVFVTERARG